MAKKEPSLCMDFCIMQQGSFFGHTVRRVVKFDKTNGHYIQYKGINIKIQKPEPTSVVVVNIEKFKNESKR